MARPQGTPRGFWAKTKIQLGSKTLTGNSTGLILSGSLALSGKTSYMSQNSTGVKLPVGLALSAASTYMTQNSTGVKLPTGLALSGQAKYFTGNSTATLIFPTVTAIPTARQVGGVVFVNNSTGKMLAYHSTGTTWKYANVTSVLA